MMSMNSAYVDELYFDFLRDPESVSPEWRTFFQNYTPESIAPSAAPPSKPQMGDGSTSTPVQPARPPQQSKDRSAVSSESETRLPFMMEGDDMVPLTSIAGKIAENMERSLSVPTATSVRTVPVKAMEENRLILNDVLKRRGKNKLSFTHILGYAIVRSLDKYPNMNSTFGVHDGIPVRIQRGSVNLGLAVDTTRRDGSRILLVPSIKNANKMNFAQFVAAYDELIQKARANKLTPDDLAGATVTLTNPGMIGTGMSMPRLMEGQGTIIATGSIEFPAEFQAVMPEVVAHLAISKVVTLTSTYDHRVIQGAESGEFLLYMHQLITGQHRFYDQIFAAYEIPFAPIIYSREHDHNPFNVGEQPEIIDKEGRVIQLIHAYRVRGHVLADINPLGLEAYYYPELDPAHYGFSIWDLDREFDTGGLGGVKRATLRDIIAMLRETYCDQIGIEWMHIQEHDRRSWVRNRVETTRLRSDSSDERKIDIYRKLTRAELLENFLHTKFLGAKRFSLEGGESALIILDELLANSASSSLLGVVIGMAHRGRINVLANMMGKPLENVFSEFEGSIDPESLEGSGDVKYHLGARGTYTTPTGAHVPIFLAPNPSHLEAVDPVVEGIARAVADQADDGSHSRVMPILIHGDAAFAGQGVVAETLNMSRLRGYTTGGTIHIIINNQIGFTTSPEDSRSTPYASGIAKMLMVPILHVNGDDPEACRAAAQFAFDYREAFHDDVVIDMYCYRKYGHNEQDDPTATQPLLYKKIRNMQPVRKLYGDKLVTDRVITAEQREEMVVQEKDRLQSAFDARGGGRASTQPVRLNYDLFAPVQTAVDHGRLKEIADIISLVPDEFAIHAKVKSEVDKRLSMFNEGTIQWGMAEALAYGTLIQEGHIVRLTGQDSGRGTFNHRQAVQSDIQNDRRVVPLNRLGSGTHRLHIYDSFLSEYAVLGFEYGYSTISKNGFTAWEAQFGDFANGAQIVIDQFIASAEEKWGQRSNLTLLLPHGYDGQGPEHSSARLERFLQLCAQDNMVVANYTSPANLFHAIRRQVKAEWRKPLIIMTPKGYLRIFTSTVDEVVNSSYQEIFDDAGVLDPARVERIVICSGKVHYELERTRSESGEQRVALIRLEQIYPFHSERMLDVMKRYPAAKSVVWCQEEPANMGAWFFVRPYLEQLLQPGQTLTYVGRPPAASPATGSAKLHEREQAKLLSDAFYLE